MEQETKDVDLVIFIIVITFNSNHNYKNIQKKENYQSM